MRGAMKLTRGVVKLPRGLLLGVGVDLDLTREKVPSNVLGVGSAVTHIRGKTEQRCASIVEAFQRATGPMSYDDLKVATGGVRQPDGRVDGGVPYDILLFVVTTLLEVGLVDRKRIQTRKPGNPRVLFTWTGSGAASARVLGTRSAKAA